MRKRHSLDLSTIVNHTMSNHTLLGRLLRSPLQLIPSGTLVPILYGPMQGVKWIVGCANHGTWAGTYEPEVVDVFCRFLRKGDTVWDIGANVGYFTLLSSMLVGATGHVAAFEPLPRNLVFLHEHLRVNQITNVTVFPVAVSGTNGSASFDTTGSHAMGHFSDTGSLAVETVTLDSLVETNQLQPPNLIKIDIEGAELLALEGALNILSESKPTIVLSVHSRLLNEQCCYFLRQLGYHLDPLDAAEISRACEIAAHL